MYSVKSFLMDVVACDSLEIVDDSINYLCSLIDVSNGVISNQLSATNTLLTVFSILVALGGIVLGGYVTIMYRRVSKMRDHVDKINKSLIELNDKIRQDMTGLYLQLREEENKNLVRRLKDVPQDIINVLPLLLSRTVKSNLFSDFKIAYEALQDIHKQDEVIPATGLTYSVYYAQLFAQHFLYESMLDDNIRELVKMHFSSYVDCAFENDIVQSSISFCKALSAEKAHFDRADALYYFVDVINNSRYKNLTEIKEILLKNLLPVTLLPDVLERFRANGISIAMFCD